MWIGSRSQLVKSAVPKTGVSPFIASASDQSPLPIEAPGCFVQQPFLATFSVFKVYASECAGIFDSPNTFQHML
jgi:hypothetical protein